jgi:hypothetical protein
MQAATTVYEPARDPMVLGPTSTIEKSHTYLGELSQHPIFTQSDLRLVTIRIVRSSLVSAVSGHPVIRAEAKHAMTSIAVTGQPASSVRRIRRSRLSALSQ